MMMMLMYRPVYSFDAIGIDAMLKEYIISRIHHHHHHNHYDHDHHQYTLHHLISLSPSLPSSLYCSVPELLSLILDTMEHDFHATPSICKSAVAKTVMAGGLPSLRKLYPWHPTFSHGDSSGNNNKTSGSGSALAVQESFNSAKTEVLKNQQAGNIKGKQLLQLSMSSIPGQRAAGQVSGHDLEDQLALATVVATALGDKASDKKLTSNNAKLSAEVARNLGR